VIDPVEPVGDVILKNSKNTCNIFKKWVTKIWKNYGVKNLLWRGRG
jgi:hypothetical protein